MMERMNAARKAVLAAGTFLEEQFGREIEGGISEKRRNDFVTEIDRESERMIKQVLGGAFPDIGVYAEEGGATGPQQCFWIIDPLDGTTNFIHRYPVVTISLALFEEGRTSLGLVYDPLRKELFEAVRGDGAYCNGKRIRVSLARDLRDSLLGTGFPFSVHKYIDLYLAAFRQLFLGCRGMRRAGSAALDLCYVASGRLDGFWELYLKPWDMAAGALIVEEAGGIATDFFGGDGYLSAGHIVAASPAILPSITKVTSAVFTPSGVDSLATPFPAER
jgi:myo-inositol-1(or 4)-monophosphatase